MSFDEKLHLSEDFCLNLMRNASYGIYAQKPDTVGLETGCVSLLPYALAVTN